LVYGDLRDATSLEVAFRKACPDEIYNLAGQVFVPTSWECPSETFRYQCRRAGPILQIVERQKPEYAGLSGLQLGNVWQHQWGLQRANPAQPRLSIWSFQDGGPPYFVRVYRERGLFAAGGIFSITSLRGGDRRWSHDKITRAAARWMEGDEEQAQAREPDGPSGLGFRGRLCEAMHAMLQQPEPKDYVIGRVITQCGRFLTLVLAELKGLSAMVTSQVRLRSTWRSTRASSERTRSTTFERILAWPERVGVETGSRFPWLGQDDGSERFGNGGSERFGRRRRITVCAYFSLRGISVSSK